jgi:hypothetical protein
MCHMRGAVRMCPADHCHPMVIIFGTWAHRQVRTDMNACAGRTPAGDAPGGLPLCVLHAPRRPLSHTALTPHLAALCLSLCFCLCLYVSASLRCLSVSLLPLSVSLCLSVRLYRCPCLVSFSVYRSLCLRRRVCLCLVPTLSATDRLVRQLAPQVQPEHDNGRGLLGKLPVLLRGPILWIRAPRTFLGPPKMNTLYTSSIILYTNYKIFQEIGP